MPLISSIKDKYIRIQHSSHDGHHAHSVWLRTAVIVSLAATLFVALSMEIRGQTLAFAAVTAAILLVVFKLTARELTSYRQVRAILADALPDTALADLRAAMAAGGDQRQSVIDLLTATAERVGQCGSPARPLCRQILRLVAVLQVGGSEPQELADAVRTHPPAGTLTPWMRVVDLTLVNALLFIGIIGTFYGLMLFLGDERFMGLIRALGSDSPIAASAIPDILNGFRVAFGSSLIAYIAYLVGRFLVELADDAFDETLMDMTAQIDRRLSAALTIGPTVGKVDIAPAVKRLLQEQATEVKSLARAIGGMVDRTGTITESLLRAAAELSQSVKASNDLTHGLQKTFSTLKTDWDQTTVIWRDATQTFATTASQASHAIGTSASQMVALQEALGASGTQVLDQLRALTQQTSALLAQQEERLRLSFTQAADTFAGSLSKATGDLLAGVDLYGTAVDGLRVTLNQTASAQTALEGTLDTFQQIFQQSLLDNNDTYRQLVGVFGDRSSEVAVALDRFNQTLLTLSQSLRALDRALYGGEEVESLTAVLRELNDRLAVGTPPPDPAGPAFSTVM